MVFEVVINQVFVKLSVPSFGISPARTVMGTNGSSVMGSNSRRDIVSSFYGAKALRLSVLRYTHISAERAVTEITPRGRANRPALAAIALYPTEMLDQFANAGIHVRRSLHGERRDLQRDRRRQGQLHGLATVGSAPLPHPTRPSPTAPSTSSPAPA